MNEIQKNLTQYELSGVLNLFKTKKFNLKLTKQMKKIDETFNVSLINKYDDNCDNLNELEQNKLKLVILSNKGVIPST